MKRFALLSVAAMSLSGFSLAQQSEGAGAYTPKLRGMPVLVIRRVEQMDNLDQGDALGANRADFFAEVTVNGVKTKTEVLAKDDGWPNWEIPLDYKTRYSRITIRLLDDDGGLERQDDHADINPKRDKKDLTFTYDRYTGRISGEASGRLNQPIVVKGEGDDDKARITFMVMKA
ncbi:MAG: hypothetical protein KIT11_03800 [Fimbriimonadaceae bacterium]|nr:hypothetical protein [Fimbriimonadaceae bacterium]QYK56979.1 MAG: hypothetical protein KF733_05725 [Fimbriimonadaceae bacterium]